MNNIEVYERQLSFISKESDLYEEYIMWYIDCIKLHSEELLKQFDEKHMQSLFSPVEILQQNDTSYSRTYDIGFNEYGSLVLDASYFNVKNIVEAVELFAKITGM